MAKYKYLPLYFIYILSVSSILLFCCGYCFANPQTPTTSEQYDVFISHAGEDKRSVAATIAKHLKDAGLNVFCYGLDTNPGSETNDQLIINAVSNSKYIVVILSPEYAAKKWPLLELRIALQRWDQTKANVIIPIFYRLPIKDCKNEAVLLDKYSENFQKFTEWRQYPDSFKLIKRTTDFSGIVSDNLFDFEIAEKTLNAIQTDKQAQGNVFKTTPYKNNLDVAAHLASIDEAKTISELRTIYHNEVSPLLNDLYLAVGQNRHNPKALEKWCKSWAQSMANGNPEAYALNMKRKICLHWLYKLHDLLQESPDQKGIAHANLVNSITNVCIPMDRANSLYNMIGNTGLIGKDWIPNEHSKRFVDKSKLRHPYDSYTMSHRLEAIVEWYHLDNLKSELEPVYVKDCG